MRVSLGKHRAACWLDVREWTRGACGAVLDRDVNAAVNVAKAAALAVSACGRVRPRHLPAQREETGTHPKPHRIRRERAVPGLEARGRCQPRITTHVGLPTLSATAGSDS